MSNLQRLVRDSAVALLLAVASVCVLAPMATAECHTERQGSLAADLKRNLKPYVELRERTKSNLPALKETEDPATLLGRQEALAKSIRAARRDAK